MEVKTITPREDLNHELDNMDEQQILELLSFARKLASQGIHGPDLHRNVEGEPTDIEPEAAASPQLLATFQPCPLWYFPEEDAAWAHL